MAKKKEKVVSKTAVIYARYSSHNQREESIEQQVDECTEYAARHGLTVTDVYADKALTGQTDNRPAFQRLNRDIERGTVKTIIVYKSNRLYRNMLLALSFEDKIQSYGVTILYCKEDFPDNAQGRFTKRMMMSVNQLYSEDLSENITRGLRDNAKNCLVNNGKLPFGYCKGEDGKYAIVPSEAETVRWIFESTLAGTAFVDMANELNGKGITTSTGALWNKNSFATLLRNERYIGVYIWDDIRIEDGIPPIIKKELFFAVQEKLSSKREPRARHREAGDYLLTGKLRCGKCRSFMIGVSGTGRCGDKFCYYACTKRKNDHICDKRNVQRDWVERHVASCVVEYILQERVIQWICDITLHAQKHSQEKIVLNRLREQLANVNRSIGNMIKAMEKGIITDSTRQRMLELEAEKKRIEQRIVVADANNGEITEEQIRFFMDSFKDGDADSKAFQKRVIDTFVTSVFLYDDKMEIRFSFDSGRKRVPFAFEDKDSETSLDECSNKLSIQPPSKSQTNHTAILYHTGKAFVLTVSF